jgi:hypothetical protein
LDAALAVAEAWPPLRTASVELVRALALGGRTDDARRVMAPLPAGDDTRTALLRTVAETVADPATKVEFAREWLDAAPCLEAFALIARSHGSGWPALRDRLVAELLQRDEAVWLVPVLAAEPDAVAALRVAVEAGPLRDRTARAALEALTARDPLVALRARCVRLHALCAAADLPSRTLRAELDALIDDAAAAGEKGLALDYARLLGREGGHRNAVAQAVAAVIGERS